MVQWNWIDDPDISPHNYEYLSFLIKKPEEIYNGKKKASSINGVGLIDVGM